MSTRKIYAKKGKKGGASQETRIARAICRLQQSGYDGFDLFDIAREIGNQIPAIAIHKNSIKRIHIDKEWLTTDDSYNLPCSLNSLKLRLKDLAKTGWFKLNKARTFAFFNDSKSEDDGYVITIKS